MSQELKKNHETCQEGNPPRKPEKEINDESYDKTIEDSFPASDPPSSIPDPDEDENAA